MRQANIRVVDKVMPTIHGNRGPQSATFLEIHLMGVDRLRFVDDLAMGRYDRYLSAFRMEIIYTMAGLVSVRSMN